MKDDLCKQSTHFCQYLAIHVVNLLQQSPLFFADNFATMPDIM